MALLDALSLLQAPGPKGGFSGAAPQCIAGTTGQVHRFAVSLGPPAPSPPAAPTPASLVTAHAVLLAPQTSPNKVSVSGVTIEDTPTVHDGVMATTLQGAVPKELAAKFERNRMHLGEATAVRKASSEVGPIATPLAELPPSAVSTSTFSPRNIRTRSPSTLRINKRGAVSLEDLDNRRLLAFQLNSLRRTSEDLHSGSPRRAAVSASRLHGGIGRSNVGGPTPMALATGGAGCGGGGRQMFDKRTLRRRNKREFRAAIDEWCNQRTAPGGRYRSRTTGCHVAVRLRPIFEKELQGGEFEAVTVWEEWGEIVVHNCLFQADLVRTYVHHLGFCFPRVFDANATNEQIYLECGKPGVAHALNGQLGSLFMFGQTGSGKTYTMHAIMEHASREIFSELSAQQDEASSSSSEAASLATVVVLRAFEVAGRKCFDLLARQRTELKLLDDQNGRTNICGAVEVPTRSADDCVVVLREALQRRATAGHARNEESSRSHCVCVLDLVTSNDGKGGGGSLILVDCAGTERRQDSDQHSSERMRESAEINASLHALKECIRYRCKEQRSASEEQGQVHVPYRDSQLTRVLQESFTRPGSYLAAIGTISPTAMDTEHTLSTLRTMQQLLLSETGNADVQASNFEQRVDIVSGTASRSRTPSKLASAVAPGTPVVAPVAASGLRTTSGSQSQPALKPALPLRGAAVQRVEEPAAGGSPASPQRLRAVRSGSVLNSAPRSVYKAGAVTASQQQTPIVQTNIGSLTLQLGGGGASGGPVGSAPRRGNSGAYPVGSSKTRNVIQRQTASVPPSLTANVILASCHTATCQPDTVSEAAAAKGSSAPESKDDDEATLAASTTSTAVDSTETAAAMAKMEQELVALREQVAHLQEIAPTCAACHHGDSNSGCSTGTHTPATNQIPSPPSARSAVDDQLKEALLRASRAERRVEELQAEHAALEEKYSSLEVLFQSEQEMRRKTHNQLLDFKGQIRVFCRIRPLPSLNDAEEECATTKRDAFTVEVSRTHTSVDGFARSEKKPFVFDAVFGPSAQQDEVFREVRELLQSAIDGYNVTILAYGQTGAGKTHTMYGGRGELRGIAPRTADLLFKALERLATDRFCLKVQVHLIELYKNDLLDLFAPGAVGKPLEVRRDARTGDSSVDNVREHEVKNAEQLLKLLDDGLEHRHTASTQMNADSSRSHLFLTISVEVQDKEAKTTVCGKVRLCDLAGSERPKRSGACGDVMREAIEINKALTALGDVIDALTRNTSRGPVPYRNHKLTQLLSDSLGGSAKALMFVNVSAARADVEETVNSLTYASRARNIVNDIRVPSAYAQAPQVRNAPRNASPMPVSSAAAGGVQRSMPCAGGSEGRRTKTRMGCGMTTEDVEESSIKSKGDLKDRHSFNNDL